MSRVPTISEWIIRHARGFTLNAGCGPTTWGSVRLDYEVRFKPDVRGDVGALPFDKELFDGAILADMLEHVPKGTEPAALSEINRVMKPGGWLLLTTPNNIVLGCLLDPGWWLMGHRHYRRSDLVRLLVSSRFVVTEAKSTGNAVTESVRVLLSVLRYVVYQFIGRRGPSYFEGTTVDTLRDDDKGYTVFIVASKAERNKLMTSPAGEDARTQSGHK